jgi:hypothetical protein
LGVLAVTVLSVGSANAVTMRYCSQPMAPTTYLRKPDRPFCAASRSCDEADVSSYRSDVERYYRQLRQYATEVDQFYADATEYVRCMADLD